MRNVEKQYMKYVFSLFMLTALTACGSKEADIAGNPQEAVTEITVAETEEGSEESGDIQPTTGTENTMPEQPTMEEQTPAGEVPIQLQEEAEREGNWVIKELSPEEWEQIEQDETMLTFYSGGGYVYVNLAEERIYYREIYAHEREEGAEFPYFHPQYSSSSDGTMFATGSTDESGEQLYDVYYGTELLIRDLSIDAEEMHKQEYASEYVLDICYDADAQEVLLLTYHKDSEKKEEGFMIYHAAENDTCIQPLRFFPILTGDAYQENVYGDWIWSALLTPDAIYYDTLPVRRIDMETGGITEWGLSQEAYTEMTGIDNPISYQDTKMAGNGYIMIIVANPDPAFGDFTENTMDTYLIYTEDGELVHMIPNVH